MIYRLRTYQAVPENLDRFNEFFEQHLLPTQLRHGARLVGRWSTEDGRVVAIWEYESRAEYERIQSAVAADPETARAQQIRATLPPLFTNMTETFMVSTVS
jgi:NIPSNAP protein